MADVNTTKADKKNLTLIVVEKVHQKGSGPKINRLASEVGMISRLFHPSYITSVTANLEIVCLLSALDEWTGLPKMTECFIDWGQGKYWGCKCKHGKRYSCSVD